MASSDKSSGGARRRTLDDITKDSFSFGFWRDAPITTLALSSLRLALEAWFSTYQAVGHRFHVFTSDDIAAEDADFNHGLRYFEAQSEALVHFQHFVELACKDLLRAEHVLLATRAQHDPVVLHKLLRGEAVSDEEVAREPSIEFSQALEHLVKLIKAKRLARGDLDFIAEHHVALSRLNHLRNRIWHRGTMVLRYRALDELVGRFLLPVIRGFAGLPEYARSTFWQPRPVACKLDILGEIGAELARPAWSLEKVAYLKELGRAAYHSPLRGEPMLADDDARKKAQARRAARTVAHPYEIRRCPACGVKSLIEHDDINHDEETGEAESFVWKVECTCCSFTVRSELGSAPALGLPLDDFFMRR
jgi:hypothetical protein